MNNLKKIGLTALAASLVSTSAFAAELTASGSASIKAAHVTEAAGADTGKAFSMGNSVTFSGAGELDNGMSVSVSFELDQGTADGTTSPFDSHSATVSSDAMGSLTFAGHGGDSAQSQVKDMTGKIWDYQGTSQGALASSTSNNMMLYTLPTLVDGVSLKASYVPKGTSAAQFDSAVDYAIQYTGVEGLTVGYASGEDNSTSATEADVDTMYAKYAFGPVTVAYSASERDEATAANDRDHNAYSVAYTVSDNISVYYGVSTQETPGTTTDADEEVSGVSASYTSGGMTISGAMIDIDNQGFVSGTKSEAWELGLAFAF
ncbi:porin [Candidatus Pelagibacter sp.]|nr:porin [Candidatus Pelagibacter sp.]